MKRYAGYVRVSSEEQKKSGLSIEHQRERIKEHVERNGGTLHRIYEDLGKSGGSTKREGFQEMLNDARGGDFDAIVFLKLDRFGRSVIDILTTIKELGELGVEVTSIDGRIDTSAAHGKFQLTLVAGLAELERDLARERTIGVHLMKLQQGLPVSPPPYGYRWSRKQWVVVPKEAGVVLLLFKKAAAGKPIAEIWKHLPITKGHMYRILKNRAYVGKLVYQGQEYDGKHEALVSEELWRLAQLL